MPYTDTDRAERHSRILAELAEVGMRAVRDLSDALEAAETVVDKERLALSLHRMSRDLRLTIALEERLDHERRKGARETGVDRRRAAEHRQKQVEYAVCGQACAEREGEDLEAVFKKFDQLVEEQMLHDDFLDRPLEAVIEELCKALGLKGAPLRAAESQAELGGLQPPQSAEFTLGPAEGWTRGSTAPPEGEQLGAPPKARAGPS